MGKTLDGQPVRSRSTAVLSLRERAAVTNRILKLRLDTILPVAMRDGSLDMWIVICQEDNLDPLMQHLVPMDTWCPILQIYIFAAAVGKQGIERMNLSLTDTRDLYEKPWGGYSQDEQWELLAGIVEQRNPERIGINIGSTQWAAGGLTHNLYTQLIQRIPARFVDKLVSAEGTATRYLSTLTEEEIELYEHVVGAASQIIEDTYSRAVIVPGHTTVDDLVWLYWQRCADLGLTVSFKPSFYLIRSDRARRLYGRDDRIIRHGDCIRCDVGIHYLRLNTDHQRWVYVCRPGEHDAPAGLRALMRRAVRLQEIFLSEFHAGLTGNTLLENILERAEKEGVANAKVYSHSLGLFLHEPGPLIGLPWEQQQCHGRGDVSLLYNSAFTMELSVAGAVAEWNNQEIQFALEEDVVFTGSGCRLIGNRQEEFYLV